MFHADPVGILGTDVAHTEHHPLRPPTGYFSVLRSREAGRVPDAESEKAESTNGRERVQCVPRLARQLWRLLEAAHRCEVPPIGKRAVGWQEEFSAIQQAAERIEIAEGVSLASLLMTHPNAYHRRAIFAKLRQQAAIWPNAGRPQAFLLLYTPRIVGNRLEFRGLEPIHVLGTVAHASGENADARAPYLTLVLVAHHPEAGGYAAVRAYAQPILSSSQFVAVESDFERRVLRFLMDLQRRIYRIRPDLEVTIRKPLFDLDTPLGPCRPNFIVDIQENQANGESVLRGRYVVEAMGYRTDDYVFAKSRTHPRMAHVGRLITIDAMDLERLSRDEKSLFR